MRISRFTILLALTILPLDAADQPALRRELKPLGRGLGHWTYDMKGDNGEQQKGYFTSTVACGGNLVVSREQLTQQGKLVFGSIGVSYWEPATKSIKSIYADSEGVHAKSILLKSGDRQVSQGWGYDGKGKFFTAMPTVEFGGKDEFTGQIVHDLTDGKPQPDSPKWICRRSVETFTPTADLPQLNENLKALAKTLGKWTYSWPADNGKTLEFVETRSADANGAVVVTEGHELGAKGKKGFSYFGITYWQPETKSLAEIGVDSAGNCSRSVVTIDGAKRISHGYGHDAKGVFGSFLETHEMKGDDTMEYQMTHVIRGGAVQPDEPKQKLILRRARN